jgi:hypothetical protein
LRQEQVDAETLSAQPAEWLGDTQIVRSDRNPRDGKNGYRLSPPPKQGAQGEEKHQKAAGESYPQKP